MIRKIKTTNIDAPNAYPRRGASTCLRDLYQQLTGRPRAFDLSGFADTYGLLMGVIMRPEMYGIGQETARKNKQTKEVCNDRNRYDSADGRYTGQP